MTRLPIDGEDPWGVVRADWDLTEHNNDGTHKFSGTPTGSKFLRDDRSWQVPAGGGSGLTEWFDVTATYGGVGDGVANDTTPINNAVAAAQGAGGGVVYLSGLYKYVASAQLDIPSNVVLIGNGWSSGLLISASGASGYVRMPSGNTGCGIFNMSIERGNTTATYLVEIRAGNSTVRGNRIDGNATAGNTVHCDSGADGVLVTENTFTAITGNGATGRAFSAANTVGLRFLGNRIEGHLGDGNPVYLNTNNTKYQISDNQVLSDAAATATSILVVTSGAASVATHGVISGNYVEAVAEGIDVQKTSVGDQPHSCSITGNTVKALAAPGGIPGISVIMDRGTISGNTVDNNGLTGMASGIELNKSSYNAVTGNMIYGLGGTLYGIFVEGGSHNTIAGNVIYGIKDATNAGSAGIFLYADLDQTNSNDNSITGNHVYFDPAAAGTLEHGILLQSNNAAAHVDRNVIVGNQIYGNNVTNSRGVSLDLITGTLDKTLIGMNGIHNCASPIFQGGDTYTLRSGSIWNLTGSLADINTQSGATYTLVLTDSEKQIKTTSASAVTLTVPPAASVAFLTGTIIEIAQYGAGQVTVAAGAGVTIRSPSGKLKITGQYSKAAIEKIGTNEWWLEGDIAA